MNTLIVNKLNELLQYYETDKSLKWKKLALQKALTNIINHPHQIISGDYAKQNIANIGTGIASRIDEILSTNSLEEIQNNSLNPSNDAKTELKRITGVGDTRVNKWIEQGIYTINDLKQQVANGKVKLTHHIMIGLKYVFDFEQPIPRNEIDDINKFLNDFYSKLDKNIIFNICGSYRRGLSTSGDIDILLSHKNNVNYLKHTISELTKKGFIIDNLTENGDKKYMGVCKINSLARRIDIRYIEYESYYPALIYFTGSKNFNVKIRKDALKKNLSISEYGIKNSKTNEVLLFHSEEDFFKYIDLDFINPCDRNI